MLKAILPFLLAIVGVIVGFGIVCADAEPSKDDDTKG